MTGSGPRASSSEWCGDLNEGRAPRTFLISGSPCLRGTALALEQLALREGALRARVQEGEFGVQAIVGALADGLVVADGERRIRLMNDAFRQMFGLGPETTMSPCSKRCATRPLSAR